MLLHDLACVVHLHSTHSDGTGTVGEIVAAGRRAGVDAVLLTDHDSLGGRDQEGWHGSVLLLVGEEVSPHEHDHTLAFGRDAAIDHRGMTGAEIAAAAPLTFAAHPFSLGSTRYRRFRGMPHTAPAATTGVELWSFVMDTLQTVRGPGDIARFVREPDSFLDHPPQRNVIEWERLCAHRRCVALGGLDAHQVGVRLGGRVPLRLMGYARSFRYLRTHVLCDSLPDGTLEHDRALIYDALAEGRCYLARDSLAPGRGFAFWCDDEVPMGAEVEAGDHVLHVRLPRPADELRLLRDGVVVAGRAGTSSLDLEVSGAGVFRVEARLRARGRTRTWVLSNPIYVRDRGSGIGDQGG